MPADADAIAAFFDALSPESRYLRFRGHGSAAAQARSYSEADGDARVALIAEHGGRVVAVAGYERLREPRAAEAAFAVADDFQGRGVGTRMLEQLAERAATQGLERFDAEILAENRRMLRVFESAGFEVRREGVGGELRLSLDIRPTERVAERIADRHHRATVASLRPLLAPRSVAVVGASDASGSVGGAIFRNVADSGFEGVVTPVNRSRKTVRGVPAATSVAELAEPPDLAVLAVPAEQVLGVAAEAGAAGVRALVVVSTGFADAGDEHGRARQDRLLAIVRAHGMRLLGPNSLGLLSYLGGTRLNATIGSRRDVRSGEVALSSQSSALGVALLGHAVGRSLGIGSFVSLGNRADISTNDLLEYWGDDDGLRALLLYVESFGNPRRFAEIARRVARRKAIVAVKGSRFHTRLEAPRSHTAAAISGEAVVDALFRQAGVLRVERSGELFDAAELLVRQPLPGGRRVGVVTNSGGLGTLTADACLTRGLGLADLDAVTQKRLRRSLPAADQTENPVDLGIGAGAADYAEAVSALLADPAVDALVVLCAKLSGGEPVQVLDAVEEVAAAGEKPVLCSIVGPDGQPPADGGRRVPNFPFPEACVGALALAADRRDWLARPLGQRPALDDVDPEAARAEVRAFMERDGKGWLPAGTTQRLLATHGIALAPAASCADPDAAAAAAASLVGPVALKAEFPPPEHASDVDAVLLGLEGEPALRAGWEELARRAAAGGRRLERALVQVLVGPGADILLGSVTDPGLGPVVGLGIGGRESGAGRELAFRLLPDTDADADELISAAPGVPARLARFRGGPELDRGALRELVLRFARLLEGVPEIVEADLNPVRVMREGCSVLDARARVAPPPRLERLKTW